MSFLSVTAGHAARVVLLLALALSANAANAGKIFTSTSAHPLDSVRLGVFGHTSANFADNDAGWASVLSGASGPFVAIMVGENPGRALSAATKTSIASYVSTGGRIIVASDHAGNVAFMNSVFGYATTLNYGCASAEDVAGTKQPAATGTEFGAGPLTVTNLSCTSALNIASVPAGAATIYAGTGTALTFAADFGSGRFVWLGYDYCCGAAAKMDDWYIVLDSAIKFTGLFTNCSDEGFTGSKLTLCRQVCEVPQRASTLANLSKMYTTLYKSPIPCSSVTARL